MVRWGDKYFFFQLRGRHISIFVILIW